MYQNQKKNNINYFILIFGPPGSGKSTLANKINQQYQKYCITNNNKYESIVISADNVQQYLRLNTVQQLDNFIKQNGLKQLNKYCLKRALFKEKNWKYSRQYIQNNIFKWINQNQLLILQDDCLLKSQRKRFRQIIQNSNIKYIEINLNTNLQECIKNIKLRNQTLFQTQRIKEQVVIDSFHKFQIEPNIYNIGVNYLNQINWQFIKQNSKLVIVNHAQVKQKEQRNEQDIKKDQQQIKIRKYIQKIMEDKQLCQKYFKQSDLSAIGRKLAKLKRNYKSKQKRLSEFIQYLQKNIQAI